MRLRDYLAAHHLTARSFGETIQVSEFAIGKYVRGERIPRPAIMARISDATDGRVRANDFFADGAAEVDEEDAGTTEHQAIA